MSFGASTVVSLGGEENLEGGLALEALTRSSLINVQNSVKSVGDQVYRLTQGQPTPKIVCVMESLISESTSTISTLEDQLRQWKKTSCGDAATAALVLPPLEAGFNAEVEKLKRYQKMLETTEKQLQSSDLIDSFTSVQSSEAGGSPDPSALDSKVSTSMNRFELAEIPRDLLEAAEQQQQPVTLPPGSFRPSGRATSAYDFSAYTDLEQPPSPMLPVVNSSTSRASRGQQQCFSSNPIEFAPPGVVGRHFYDHADDDDDSASDSIIKNVMPSLSLSTSTGRSGSPMSEDEEERGYQVSSALSNGSSTPTVKQPRHSQAFTSDSFLEDDYLHHSYRSRPGTSKPADARHTNECYDNDDDTQEFSGLLSRGSVRSASYLDGWHLTVDPPRQQDNNDLELYVSQERLRGVRRIKAQLSQISNVFRELAHLINEQQDDLDLIDSNIMNIKNSTGSAVEELRRANAIKQRARRRNLFMILVTLAVAAVVLFVYFLQSPSVPPYVLTAPKPLVDETPPRDSVHDLAVNRYPRRHAISFIKGNHPSAGSSSNK